MSGGSRTAKSRIPKPPPSYVGMEDCWVIVALSQLGEKEKNLEAIQKSIHRILRRAISVFIPAKKTKVREEEQVNIYLDGYVFIKFEDGLDYTRLNETPLFQNVLVKRLRRENGERYFVYCLVKDKELDAVRNRMSQDTSSGFSIGDHVLIKQGTYKNLKGHICFLYEDGNNCQIKVVLRSKSLLVDFPLSYVAKVVVED